MRLSLLSTVTGGFLLLAPNAFGFELDTLLPTSVPGYGVPFWVRNLPRVRDDGTGFDAGGVRVNPELDLGLGYDSAPNGASPGSALFTETPSVSATDAALGLGGFAAADFRQVPQNAAQATIGGAVALGEKAALTTQTITTGAAFIAAQATGFALTSAATRRPIAFTLADARIEDAIGLGLLTLTPRFDIANYRFSRFSGQDRRDTREDLQAAYADGGPLSGILLLEATQSAYRDGIFDSTGEAALAGAGYDASDIVTVRLLAGAARHASDFGGTLVSPVVEGAVDWLPDRLDRFSVRLAREIDNPDDISATPYTLNEARLSLAHEYLRDVTLNASADLQAADYIGSPLKETIFSSDAGIAWQLNRSWAVTADYVFNDRQANFLRAANEHVGTLALKWTP